MHTVMHLLGHKNIKTTQRYVHADQDKIKESVDEVGNVIFMAMHNKK